MRRSLLLPSLLATAAIALAGCGSSGGGSSSGGSTTGASGAPASGGGGTVAVKMQSIAFAPTSVTVKVGQKVTWTNEDSVPHNVTSRSGEKIASPTFSQGGTFSFTPTKAGTIDYVCTIHPGMNGKLVVTK